MFAGEFGLPTTTFIYNEVKYFSQKHQLKFLCLKRINPDLFPHENVQVLEFPENRIIKKLKWLLWQKDFYLSFKNRRFARQLNKVIKDYKPDVIHCHFAYEGLKLLENLQQNNIPVILHFHGYDASQMLKKASYVRKLKHYLSQDIVYPVFVSDFMKRSLEKQGLGLSKGLLLRYGIDISLFERSPDREKSPGKIFLQVSSLAEKKGHEYTLKAFSIFLNNVKDPQNYKLIFTGGGERMEVLKRMVLKLGIPKEQVEFAGLVNSEKARFLMQEADFFVHHSITTDQGDQEGIPNAIMEAMAMELPVLSTFHAGIPELVEDGINGYLVEEKDIEAYAQKMMEIVSWEKIPQNRLKVAQHFEFSKHNEYLENFYKLISAERSSI